MVTFLALIVRGLGEGQEGKLGLMESYRNILPFLLKVSVFMEGSSSWVLFNSESIMEQNRRCYTGRLRSEGSKSAHHEVLITFSSLNDK